ncbi:MAG: protein kinase, partial [Deltaproteobacteria bacterium]|nr:protein kinase [Deltaproteobacteria bacterium]
MRICSQCGTRFSEPVAFCPHDGTPTQEAHEEPPKDPYIGRVVDGRYRVESVLGEGGMGIVYLIAHAVLGKRMALKLLRGDMSRDAEVVQRFIQEAQSATQIGHPNIIDISDFGKMPDGTAYFVMEYLDGLSLTDIIARGGSIPTQRALHIIRQIASALDAAHERGIVHRDMKPDNIFVVKQGADDSFVKVLDFGIAKVGGASSKLTKTGMIFGTPHYMSPEQAAGQTVDRRTDIYALGVIMYEMFAGRVPFDGDTFMGILSKHMFQDPIPPSQAKGVGLGAIEDVILKALSKKVETRYQTMSEMIADLDKVQSGGSISIGRGGIAPPGNLADVLEPPSRTSCSSLSRRSRRSQPSCPARCWANLVFFGIPKHDRSVPTDFPRDAGAACRVAADQPSREEERSPQHDGDRACAPSRRGRRGHRDPRRR